MKLPLHLLLPTVTGIPVLMYHRVCEGINDRLTITPGQLKNHFQYLKDNGYTPLSISEFLSVVKGEKPFVPNSVLLTFDDGYENNLTLAYPLLKSFNFKATFFIIGNTIDGTAAEEPDIVNKKMSLEQLKQLDPVIVQLALHTYGHIHFGSVDIATIKSDLKKNIDVFNDSGLPFYKILAYPFGSRPKKQADKQALWHWMQENNIEAAFRIGNKPCTVPATQLFELKRIDIWGTDSVTDLSIKLKKGKLKPF